MKTTKLGKVKLTYLDSSLKSKYEDSAEKFLLDFFKEKPESKRHRDIYKILNNDPSWDVFYNLHPQRRHILDWYDFKAGKSLLDIGAGTGAVSGIFLDKGLKVTALELTDIRAEILAYRFRDKDGLTVVAGHLDDFKPKQQFDYLNMTGVLEYSGMFSKENNPNFLKSHMNLLQKCSSFLKRGGKIIIAIENPLGIRYLTGAVEDHYGELFQGVQNYPQYNGIRTFTKTELKKILVNSGFKEIDLYLPFPDYKMPRTVFHESYVDSFDQISLTSYLQNIDYAHPLFKFFSEILFSHQLKKEKYISTFSNSFLIIAEKI